MISLAREEVRVEEDNNLEGYEKLKESKEVITERDDEVI